MELCECQSTSISIISLHPGQTFEVIANFRFTDEQTEAQNRAVTSPRFLIFRSWTKGVIDLLRENHLLASVEGGRGANGCEN